MAITTYAELKSAVTNWSKRGDLATYLDDIVTIAEKWIFRKARTRDMETALNVAIANGVAALPSDFVELKYAYVDGNPTVPLQIKAASYIYTGYPDRSSSSKPQIAAVEGSNLIFGPYPDSAYTIKGIYYKRLDAVSVSVNSLFTKNPDLYLFATLAELAPFLKDDARIQLWTAKRNEILAEVNGENVTSQYGTAPLAMVAA